MPARTHHAAFSCTDRLCASCAPCLLAATNRGPRPSFRAAALALVVLEVLLSVRAVGLNFRDVLNVLGEYPGDPGPPGADSSGVVDSTGASSGHAAGSSVFGLAEGPFASLARASAQL